MTQNYTRFISYRVQQTAVDQNTQRVQALLENLQESSPTGLGYLAFRLPDGEFLHVAAVSSDSAREALHTQPAFKAWAAALSEICDDPLQFTDVEVIGGFGVDEFVTPSTPPIGKVSA